MSEREKKKQISCSIFQNSSIGNAKLFHFSNQMYIQLLAYNETDPRKNQFPDSSHWKLSINPTATESASHIKYDSPHANAASKISFSINF